MLKNLFVLDPIEEISKALGKDSSSLLIMEALGRGHDCYVAEVKDLVIIGGSLKVRCRKVKTLDYKNGYKLAESSLADCGKFNVVWLRKNPPFDETYLMKLNIFDTLNLKNVFFVNDPTVIRAHNEKLTILRFPKLIAPTIVTMNLDEVKIFFDKHKKIVVKGMTGFGGNQVVLIENWKKDLGKLQKLVGDGGKFLMVQKFLKGVYAGDKRVNIVNGKIVGALVRIPQNGFIAYTGAGAKVEKTELTSREKSVVNEVAKFLKKSGIFWAGIDLIDGYLSEINLTSPSLLAYYNNEFGLKQEVKLWNELEKSVLVTR